MPILIIIVLVIIVFLYINRRDKIIAEQKRIENLNEKISSENFSQNVELKYKQFINELKSDYGLIEKHVLEQNYINITLKSYSELLGDAEETFGYYSSNENENLYYKWFKDYYMFTSEGNLCFFRKMTFSNIDKFRPKNDKYMEKESSWEKIKKEMEDSCEIKKIDLKNVLHYTFHLSKKFNLSGHLSDQTIKDAVTGGIIGGVRGAVRNVASNIDEDRVKAAYDFVKPTGNEADEHAVLFYKNMNGKTENIHISPFASVYKFMPELYKKT